MTPLKIGLLDAGDILQAHAKALGCVDKVVLHAVCDVSKKKAAHAAASFTIPNVPKRSRVRQDAKFVSNTVANRCSRAFSALDRVG